MTRSPKPTLIERQKDLGASLLQCETLCSAEMASDQKKSRSTKMADKEKENPSLPMHVILEILAWLPVKPLCRFRCVSKTWNSLTFDPNFVKMHFNKALKHDNVLHQRSGVLVSDADSNKFYSFNLSQFLKRYDTDDNAVQNDALVVNEVVRVGDISGYNVFCSNDLMLFESNGRFTLFNPGTRECKLVPKFPKFDCNAMILREIYGFGFDESTQDYKMVYGTRSKMQLRFSVYSLTAGSWQVIETEYPYQIAFFGMQGRLMNGAIHWLVYNNYVSSMVLLSFDLAEEIVREIPLPRRLRIPVENFRLSIFREYLCLILGDNEEVWVMKEYGVRKSWTKMRISIPPGQWLHSGFRQKQYDLLLLEKRLVLLNFDEDTFRNLRINGVQKVGHVAVYLRALFRPHTLASLIDNP